MGSAVREVRVVDVIVVGAGPVGLWLAAELRRAGVEVLVLEKLATPAPHTKALTILPRSLELFAMRGLEERFLAVGRQLPSYHFALLDNRLDFTVLDTPFPFALFLPQPQTEALLREHLDDLGVPVLGGHAVRVVRQEDDLVVVEAETAAGSATFSARWAVGCDGPSSVVRKSIGVKFLGTPTTMRVAVGDVRLADPPPVPSLTLNRDNGALFLAALGDGRYRVSPFDHATIFQPEDDTLTLEELRASTIRVAGTDFGMFDPGYLIKFGNATLQAETYRRNRVMLAGDAAHIHMPLGGQGMNLGLADAGNLAWKLAAVVHGWARPELLDSYHDERHPIGQRVVEDTRTQAALVTANTPDGKALRARFNEMLAKHPSLNRELAERLSGVDLTYEALSDENPLVGRRMPDLALTGTSAPSVFALLRHVRFVLLDLTGGQLGERFTGMSPALDVAAASAMATATLPEWRGVRAVLLRPDGHIGWVGPDASAESAASLLRALSGWLDEAVGGVGRSTHRCL
jgi:2-polyprenyl-6-methoxyphenol hydroxylase-like FAD-dependent oxidoreductase